jgi:hypothetical protein
MVIYEHSNMLTYINILITQGGIVKFIIRIAHIFHTVRNRPLSSQKCLSFHTLFVSTEDCPFRVLKYVDVYTYNESVVF